MNNLKLTSGLLLGCSLATSVLAHHSSAPHFDRDIEITVAGIVTELKFVNPHAYLYFDEEKDGELIQWRCELSSANRLTRIGWSADMFTAGQRISVKGAPARREENVCFLNSVTLEDGTVITRSAGFSEAEPVATQRT